MKLRTIVYVDGYNLYYSILTGSCYKWLDLHALMADVVKDAYPGMQAEIERIKFLPHRSRRGTQVILIHRIDKHATITH